MERRTKDHIITGVKCNVNSCKYWEKGNHCTAGEIEINPPNSYSSEMTDCSTFEPRNYFD